MTDMKALCNALRNDAWHHAADAIDRLEKERDEYRAALKSVRQDLKRHNGWAKTVAWLDKVLGGGQ